MMENSVATSFGAHLMFCTKNLERMGDHATNIAEAVHYMVKGETLLQERPKADFTRHADRGDGALGAPALGKAISSAVTGVRCVRAHWLLSHGALCFHAAPLTDVSHVDKAVGADNWLTIRRRHSPLTAWTFRVLFSAKTGHIVIGSGDIVTAE
jgi:PhoU domain